MQQLLGITATAVAMAVMLLPLLLQPPPAALQQPQVRLRHLQAVTLKTFHPPVALPRHATLFFELHRLLQDGQQQLVYVSESVSTLSNPNSPRL